MTLTHMLSGSRIDAKSVKNPDNIAIKGELAKPNANLLNVRIHFLRKMASATCQTKSSMQQPHFGAQGSISRARRDNLEGSVGCNEDTQGVPEWRSERRWRKPEGIFDTLEARLACCCLEQPTSSTS